MLVSCRFSKTNKREWGIDGRGGGQGKVAVAHFPETSFEFSGIFLAFIIKTGQLVETL